MTIYLHMMSEASSNIFSYLGAGPRVDFLEPNAVDPPFTLETLTILIYYLLDDSTTSEISAGAQVD
jgi:hypothetical protein